MHEVWIEHPFQYFWAMAGPHKRRGARKNFHPLDGPAANNDKALNQ